MSHWETRSSTDEWYTPKYIFDALGCVFDLDVASPYLRWHVPAKVWMDMEDDGLKLAPFWTGFIWMNAPFGGRNGIEPWLDAFFAHANGIALMPDRTSAGWFRKAWQQADLVLFTPKIRFLRPDGRSGQSPSNGTAFMAVGSKGAAALYRAERLGFGILAKPIRAGCGTMVSK